MRRAILFLGCLLAALALQANPIDDLLERIDPGASRKFKIELRRTAPDTLDYFELDQQGRRPVVRGNSWVSIAVGVNWYLKYYAGIHLSWNCMHAQLPATLPAVKEPERHTTTLQQRYAFNYCTFSYTMPFWNWARWQEEIDWLALHGVNMPLAVVGEECVWRQLMLRLGYTEQQVGEFIAGPAFLAWWAMNNLEGWGGPLPLSWYERQEQLQKQILKRMGELGMHPVLPGYCGMMPGDGGRWNGFTRPANLAPTDPRFTEVATLYYQELTRLFGRAGYYSMDPFHESKDDASIDYGASAQALLAAMKQANPRATWVVQGWTENPRPEVLAAVPPTDMLVLDLFSECRPMFGAPSIWRREGGYGSHPWLFCLLENFGANVGLHGRMDQLLHNFYGQSPLSPLHSKTCRGIGFTMEGSENNPVMFELMSELPWRPEPFTKEEWVSRYVQARYGLSNEHLTQAWLLLAQTIYNCPAGNNQQGPHESIFCCRPSLDNFQASSWSKMKNYYDPAATLRAAQLFLEGVQSLSALNSNLEYDLVDITRQALADQARLQYQHTIANYKAFAVEPYRQSAARFLHMLLLQDSLLATRPEFRLGHWTQAARRCGTTTAESDQYEWNARVQITTWGNRYCADTGKLRDYAHKEWQGLLRDFYYPRWHTYFDALGQQMNAQMGPQPELLGGGPNANKTSAELFSMALPQAPQIDWYALEEPWTLQHNPYDAQPEGQPVARARRVINFLTHHEQQ